MGYFHPFSGEVYPNFRYVQAPLLTSFLLQVEMDVVAVMR